MGKYVENNLGKNVFVGQPFFGKLFNFGTVTIHAKRGAITVKNVTDAQKFKKEFYLRCNSEFV